jgi:hypothetical protein
VILEVRVDRVWFGDPSPTQHWRGDETLYFVSPQLSGMESGFYDDEGWFHHSRRRLTSFVGKGTSEPMPAGRS